MGKDKKHGKHKKRKLSESSATQSSKFGPSLPPETSEVMKRDLWMSDESKSIFDSLIQESYKGDKKSSDEKKEYDYSAPGLHVMKKSDNPSNNIFSRISSKHLEIDKSKHIAQMKERIKSYNKQRESDQCQDKMKSLFRKPEQHHLRRSNTAHDSYKNRDDHSVGNKYNDRSVHHRSDDSKYDENSPHGSKFDKHRSDKRRLDKVRLDEHRSDDCRSNEHRYDESRSSVHSSVNRILQNPDKFASKSGIKEQEEVNMNNDLPNVESDSIIAIKNEEQPVVTDDDLNKLSAKIVKSEILGNDNKVVKLKKKLEDMKNLQKSQKAKSSREDTVILTVTDKKGNIRPVDIDESEKSSSRKRRKHKAMPTHDRAGERDKYFPDDNNKDLADLIRDEKSINKLGQDELFMKYAGKLSKMSQDRQNWTLDDMFESKIAVPKHNISQNPDKIISDNIKEHKKLESCHMCLEKCSKGSIIHIGTTLYVRVPPHKSLTRNHCQIVPINHIIASVNGDEDFWEELKTTKWNLVDKFKDKKYDLVFLEMVQKLGHRRHTVIDCIPLPFEESALLPGYFKKEILECDVEWSQNKKLIDTKSKGLKRSIPQGLPYFSVEFGNDGGYAHVIEDERLFKRYFGLEIIGGFLDCDISAWRNPEKESTAGLEYKKKKFQKLEIKF